MVSQYRTPPAPKDKIYQVNAVNPGFKTIGTSRWHETNNASGKMAVKLLMFHDQGMKGPVATMIMPMMTRMQNSMLHLNLRETWGTSLKKLVRVTSLAVAPHCSSMLVID